ncbi:MAG: hypothetical protein AAF724_21055, partial [Pseudomonadota bacterium]
MQSETVMRSWRWLVPRMVIQGNRKSAAARLEQFRLRLNHLTEAIFLFPWITIRGTSQRQLLITVSDCNTVSRGG